MIVDRRIDWASRVWFSSTGVAVSNRLRATSIRRIAAIHSLGHTIREPQFYA